MQNVIGNPGNLSGAGVVGVSVGRVERVLAELLAEFCLALLNLCEACLVGRTQFGPRQHKIANGVFVCLALLGAQGGDVHRLVFGVKALIGTQARPELGDPRQRSVVCGANLRRISYAIQVADCPPGPTESLGSYIEHASQVEPVRREVGRDGGFKCEVGLLQQLIDRRGDVLRLNAVEEWQVGEIEKRVGHF